MNETRKPKIIESVKYGVRIIIPPDLSDSVDVKFEDVIWIDQMGMESDKFTVHRIVTNYVFVTDKQKFDTSIKLHVFLTHDELKELPQIRIAKWDEEQETWILFENAIRYKFPRGHLWAGFYELDITSPTDPPIAVG